MTVSELIVRMAAGDKLETRFGARGGFLGYFLGGRKIDARTFGAAKRQQLIMKGQRPDPSAKTFFPRREEHVLTSDARAHAERMMATADRYSDIAMEHRFTHLVPGVVIFYGYMLADCHEDRGKWIASHPVSKQALATGIELRDCVQAARRAVIEQNAGNQLEALKSLKAVLGQKRTFSADIGYAKRIANDAKLDDVYAALDLGEVDQARDLIWAQLAKAEVR